MPDGQLWNDGAELKEKLLDMSKWSQERFRKTIEAQRKYIDTPIKECGLELKNWWREDNINGWARIWAVPQKMTEAKKKFIEEMNKPKEIKEEDIIFKSEDGECMIVK